MREYSTARPGRHFAVLFWTVSTIQFSGSWFYLDDPNRLTLCDRVVGSWTIPTIVNGFIWSWMEICSLHDFLYHWCTCHNYITATWCLCQSAHMRSPTVFSISHLAFLYLPPPILWSSRACLPPPILIRQLAHPLLEGVWGGHRWRNSWFFGPIFSRDFDVLNFRQYDCRVTLIGIGNLP